MFTLKDRKSPILPTVTLKPGSGATQSHWFRYHSYPISDQ